MLILTCPTHKHHKRIYDIRSNDDDIYYCSHSEHERDATKNIWTARELEEAHKQAKEREDNADAQ